MTVTGAQTIDGYARLRGDAHALDAAARACDAVGRLFETSEPHPGVFNLLCRQLGLLDQLAGGGTRPTDARPTSARAAALAFRLKLLLAAGLAPQLAACATCGEEEDLVGFSGAAGGVVCAACEAGSFPLHVEAHGFMTEALGRALTDVPDASGAALGQVERAISVTLPDRTPVGSTGARKSCKPPRKKFPIPWRSDARPERSALQAAIAAACSSRPQDGGSCMYRAAPWTRVCRSLMRCSRRASPCSPATASRSAPSTTWWRRRSRTSSTGW